MTDDGNHYGFTLSEELVLLRDQVRRFMREEVKPVEDKLPYDATHCDPEDEARLRVIAEGMGLGRLNIPAEYGGQDNDNWSAPIEWSSLNVRGRSQLLKPNYGRREL